MNQMGTRGTTLLNTSRARRKAPMRKVMHQAPEVVHEAQDHKLSPFVTIPGARGPVLGSGTLWFVVTAFMRSFRGPDKSGHDKLYHDPSLRRLASLCHGGYTCSSHC